LSRALRGLLTPHAPLLLPEVVGEDVAAETEAVRTQLRSLSLDDADLVVVLSPHARTSGVYGSVVGTLQDFGVPGIEVQRQTDANAVRALADLWNRPVRDSPIDHGVLVPLMMLPTGEIPIVAAGIMEAQAPASFDEAIADALTLAEAIVTFARDRSIWLVISAHTSSALTARAPLTEREEAKMVEIAVLEALRGDPSTLESSIRALWSDGGSCSPGTLAVVARVFAGRTSEVLAYQHPFGVGYAVARMT
jgi:aromatic ring-opening dioxygenase LigB subunit